MINAEDPPSHPPGVGFRPPKPPRWAGLELRRIVGGKPTWECSRRDLNPRLRLERTAASSSSGRRERTSTQFRAPSRLSGGATTRASPKRESKDLVDHLQGIGEDVEFLVFEDEGRDVLKFTNHARGHNAIVDLSGST